MDDNEWPRNDDPTHGSAHAHKAKLIRRVLKICEGQGVGHGQGGHIKQAVDQETNEERPEGSHESRGYQSDAAYQMAESEEFLRGKVSISELVAKKDPHNRRNAEHASGKVLLPLLKPKHGHVGEEFNLPSSPNGDLEDHHDEELILDIAGRGLGHGLFDEDS